MKKANLVLQSFGNTHEYKRALFAILSYYAHIGRTDNKSMSILFTDSPEWFEVYLNDISVKYILLSKEKIEKMKGEINFLHRMKIAIIEEAFKISEGVLFYIDSDCFFIADPRPIIEEVSEKDAFMHKLEYQFVEDVEDKTITYKKFYELINKKHFKLSDGNEFNVSPKHSSWNAGVMVFHPVHAKFITDVYALTDQFFPFTQSHASEQYAFSLIMQENLFLKPCDHIVYHYWHRIKKQIADQFFDKNITNEWKHISIDQKLAEVKNWANELPVLFSTHEWTLRDNAIQAFNENKFKEGYKWAAKAFLKKPFSSMGFLKDVLYHTKRKFSKNA